MKISFGPFILDFDTRQLTRGGREIHISPKAFELLAALAAERPAVLSKAILQQRLWPDTFVAEANLSNLIAEIRAALGDSPREPQYVRTVHKFGYAFCGEAAGAVARPAAPVAPTCWIDWAGRSLPLFKGEHVIGRDLDVAIRLDSATVSRRHARIVVTAAAAVLEDFGSKNGTFHRDTRVTAPTPLADGDAIRVGSHLLTFRRRGADSTETHVGPPA